MTTPIAFVNKDAAMNTDVPSIPKRLVAFGDLFDHV
jgi:hypothetical protein